MNRFLLILLLFTFSCTSRTTDDLQKIIGQPLTIPNTLTAHVQRQDTTITLDTLSPKLLVYYDFDGCSSCKLKELLDWNQYLEELDSIAPKYQKAFIMNVKQYAQKTKMDLIVYQFKHPVFFDTNSDFETQNLLPKSQVFHVFLLDCNNKVVLVGSPIGNPKMWELYKSTINKLMANGGKLPQ